MKSITAPFQIVLKLLFKWWWLIAISAALGAGVGYFIRTKQPDIYFARATIWFGQDIGQIGKSDSLNAIQDLMTLYGGLAQQDKILQPVIDKLGLSVGVSQLQDRLSVGASNSIPLLEITFSDTDPTRAAAIANAIAQEVVNQDPQNPQDSAFQRLQLSDLQKQITTLKQQYDRLVLQAGDLTSAADITANQEEQARVQATLQSVQQMYITLSSTMSTTASLLQIWDIASPDKALKITGSFTSVILSGVGGLALALLTVILIAFFDDRLQWQENMEDIQGMRVLGPMGIVPRTKLPLYVMNMPEAVESEVLRQIRAKIVLAAGDTPPKVLAVTSYDSGDGKTVTASNLATLWSQSGARTLLVDADMRKGNIHEIFSLPNVMGLSDILASRDDVSILLSRSLLESGYDNLTILPCGRSTADPAALLAKPRLSALIDIVQKQFDVIVIDTAPTIGGPDAAFVAEWSSGVVIVVHAQRTTHKALRRTIQNLQQGQNVKIYGVLFNRIALQVTSTYSRPYYRRSLAISPDQLNRELLNAGKSRSLFNANRNVMVDKKTGARLYSLSASSVQLGVTEDTLKGWIKAGYLKTERYGRRQWIREADMTEMLEKLPRHTIAASLSQSIIAPSASVSPEPAKPAAPANPNPVAKNQTGKIPDYFRGERREALLAAARETPDKPQDQ